MTVDRAGDGPGHVGGDEGWGRRTTRHGALRKEAVAQPGLRVAAVVKKENLCPPRCGYTRQPEQRRGVARRAARGADGCRARGGPRRGRGLALPATRREAAAAALRGLAMADGRGSCGWGRSAPRRGENPAATEVL